MATLKRMSQPDLVDMAQSLGLERESLISRTNPYPITPAQRKLWLKPHPLPRHTCEPVCEDWVYYTCPFTHDSSKYHNCHAHEQLLRRQAATVGGLLPTTGDKGEARRDRVAAADEQLVAFSAQSAERSVYQKADKVNVVLEDLNVDDQVGCLSSKEHVCCVCRC